jgi:D-citramalate synthase
MKDSPDYVFGFMDALRDAGVCRFMLPDTLGVLNPMDVHEYIHQIKDGEHFDYNASYEYYKNKYAVM